MIFKKLILLGIIGLSFATPVFAVSYMGHNRFVAGNGVLNVSDGKVYLKYSENNEDGYGESTITFNVGVNFISATVNRTLPANEGLVLMAGTKAYVDERIGSSNQMVVDLETLSGRSGATLNSMVGVIMPFARLDSLSPPDGWLECDGRAVSRTTYSALFSVIQTNFGSGDGATTFNLPDMRGRTMVGENRGSPVNSLGNYFARTIGTKYGAETHQMSIADMPRHTHTVIDPNHSHTITDYTWSKTTGGGSNNQYGSTGNNEDSDNEQGNAWIRHNTSYNNPTITVGDTGAGSPYNLMQPFLVTRYFIRAMPAY
ncbi:hypothetical protein EBR96_08055 [bacterium]|nr:hypothetical protein [bacterium]